MPGHDEPLAACLDRVGVHPLVTRTAQPHPVAGAVLVPVDHRPAATVVPLPVGGGHPTPFAPASGPDVDDGAGSGWYLAHLVTRPPPGRGAGRGRPTPTRTGPVQGR